MEEEQHLFELQVDQACQSAFYDMVKWSKFLSILGFIGTGIIVIIAFGAGYLLSSLPEAMPGYLAMTGAFATIMYLIIAGLVFVPSLYLFNFSVRMKRALMTMDQALLAKSLANLKTVYKFKGIIAIIYLSFVLLILIIAVISGSLLHH